MNVRVYALMCVCTYVCMHVCVVYAYGMLHVHGVVAVFGKVGWLTASAVHL